MAIVYVMLLLAVQISLFVEQGRCSVGPDVTYDLFH
jgi:hypothetical protein